MVAYFRKQNNLFMLLGAALGFGVAIVFYEQLTASVPGYFRMFFVLLPGACGAVIGRIYAGFWANRKLREYNALLYVQVQPEQFLQVFGPLVAKAPKDNIAYIDGCNKLAYACEALGRFEDAMGYLDPLEPEKLKHHTLGALATTCNSLARLYLLQGNLEEAENAVERLRAVSEAAMERAPMLGRNTQECVRLYENWLLVLKEQPTDEAYLTEEIELSKNRIHKSEIQLVLARAMANRGNQTEADELLLEALSTGKGLYAEHQARKLLSTNA